MWKSMDNDIKNIQNILSDKAWLQHSLSSMVIFFANYIS